MVGHVEKQDLRGSDQQHGFDARRILGKAGVEELPQQMAQRADAAQHGGDELAHQRAVALGERRKPRMRIRAVELGVERTMAAQHIVQDVGGDATGGEAGNFRGRDASCRCHACLPMRPAAARNSDGCRINSGILTKRQRDGS